MGRHKGKRKRKQIIGWSKVLTKDEQQKMMRFLIRRAKTTTGRQHIMSRRILLICDLLLNTGLRASELCNLRVKDSSYVLGRNVIEVYKGKGEKDRIIPISARLTRKISGYIKEMRPQTLPRHVRRSDFNPCLFYCHQRRPYTRDGLYRIIRKTAEKAGLAKRITPHKFRHTFATNSLLKKVELERLRGLMGHASVTTTAKYLHIVEQMDSDLGEQLDQAFDDFDEMFWES